MAGTGTAPATDPKTGAAGTNPPPDPKAGAAGTQPDPDDDTGAGGAPPMDADAWKRQAKKNEKAANEARTELERIRNETKTETEKALEKAREEGRAEVRGEVVKVRAEAAVLSAASNALAKPEDAVTFLADELADFVQDDGKVDRRAIDAAIAKLLKERPYLAKAGSRAAPLPGGGATQSTGTTFNDTLRAKIRGG